MSGSDQQQQLEFLAYHAWLERGQPMGSPDVDWQRAVQLLNETVNAAAQSEPQPSVQEPVVAERVTLARKPAKAGKVTKAAKPSAVIEAPLLTDALSAKSSINIKSSIKTRSKALSAMETPLEVPPSTPSPPPPTPTKAAITA